MVALLAVLGQAIMPVGAVGSSVPQTIKLSIRAHPHSGQTH